ncbi:hypothetical protein BGZ61DRAFT_479648 [Ilyonectria robusta]|uniref:uncharacterized protein n=1 Tax=Ilyonectria robusta TaxID=1079257 RepID=UPI001E8E35DD|nr:uncharacterized protein BGZ61DRAFT_479648 [Ilyonectria robusta]KAH8686542.1 hypothetical protein BGZ61DRAFT_479648 [Ilyonectria robusta]
MAITSDSPQASSDQILYGCVLSRETYHAFRKHSGKLQSALETLTWDRYCDGGGDLYNQKRWTELLSSLYNIAGVAGRYVCRSTIKRGVPSQGKSNTYTHEGFCLPVIREEFTDLDFKRCYYDIVLNDEPGGDAGCNMLCVRDTCGKALGKLVQRYAGNDDIFQEARVLLKSAKGEETGAVFAFTFLVTLQTAMLIGHIVDSPHLVMSAKMAMVGVGTRLFETINGC